MTAQPEARRRGDMRVDLKEGARGNVEIKKFEVTNGLQNMMLGSRACQPGTYTMLTRHGRLWMSDTTAEQADHWAPKMAIRQFGGRVLIGGLGLGMIVAEALRCEKVTHVDVVEIDEDVAVLVGEQYATDPRVKIHVADLYEMTWPKGTRWDVAWFDIWPDLCEDNLDEMARLARSYGRRTQWQGFWGKELLQAERRRSRNDPWRRY